MQRPIPLVRLPGDLTAPALGLGTWKMGERKRARADEVAALRLGIELGMTLIDTAEMYADGGAEEIVGEAIEGQRDRIFIISKVYPHNAGRKSAVAACERSLRRLGTDRLDMYLLHWRGNIPLSETLAAFEALRREGKVRAWGVSNFDSGDMEELLALPGGEHCAANQIYYHLECRGPEWDLLPLCRQRGVAVMAYSPIGEGRLLRSPALRTIASAIGATAAQAALGWLLTHPDVIAIPKASRPEHVHDNRGAADIVLDAETMSKLERAFPAPTEPSPLAMI